MHDTVSVWRLLHKTECQRLHACVCVHETTHLVAGYGWAGFSVAFRLTPVTHARGAGVLLPLLTVLPRDTQIHI